MNNERVQQYRRARLQALLDHSEFAGNKSKLGQALGYKNGAFLRQMIAGERPITEKTVAAIELLRGGKFAGWFEPAKPPLTAAESSKAYVAATLDAIDQLLAGSGLQRSTVVQLVDDLKVLLAPEVSSLVDQIHQRAEYARALVAQHAKGVKAPAAATSSNSAPSPAEAPTTQAPSMAAAASVRARSQVTVRFGDGNPAQGVLPLTTVDDPFTADPTERERQWYESLGEVAAKKT